MEYRDFRQELLKKTEELTKQLQNFPFFLQFAADRPNTVRVRDVHKAFGSIEAKFWSISNFLCDHGPEVMKQLEKEE